MSVRRRLPSTSWLVLFGCLALAGASLTLSAMPHYDAWGWIVWGREIVDPHRDLGTLGGPAWKPFPVLFTTLLAPLGSAAPAGWLLVARTGGLLALALAFALGRRVGGTLAGFVAAAGLLLSHGWLLYLSWGTCDPLLVAAVLGGVLLHLDGRRQWALGAGLAAALMRPEVWPFFAIYAAWSWRQNAVRRPLIAGALVLIPVLWLGPDWYSTGDPFTGSRLAAGSLEAQAAQRAGDPFAASLRHVIALLPTPVWILAVGAAVLAWRDRRRHVLFLATGCVAWVSLVAGMTLIGYAGLGRFALAPAALACVLAGCGVAEILRRGSSATVRAGLAVTMLALVAVPVSASVRIAARDVRGGEGGRPVLAALEEAIDRAGGPARVRTWGPTIVNGGMGPALAWELGVPLRDVRDRTEASSSVVFRAYPGPYTGPPPARPVGEGHEVAKVGPWELLRMSPRDRADCAGATDPDRPASLRAAGARCGRRLGRPGRARQRAPRRGRLVGPDRRAAVPVRPLVPVRESLSVRAARARTGSRSRLRRATSRRR
jgi:hypothetical protein